MQDKCFIFAKSSLKKSASIIFPMVMILIKSNEHFSFWVNMYSNPVSQWSFKMNSPVPRAAGLLTTPCRHSEVLYSTRHKSGKSECWLDWMLVGEALRKNPSWRLFLLAEFHPSRYKTEDLHLNSMLNVSQWLQATWIPTMGFPPFSSSVSNLNASNFWLLFCDRQRKGSAF